jgi:hypothetical protein
MGVKDFVPDWQYREAVLVIDQVLGVYATEPTLD